MVCVSDLGIQLCAQLLPSLFSEDDVLLYQPDGQVTCLSYHSILTQHYYMINCS